MFDYKRIWLLSFFLTILCFNGACKGMDCSADHGALKDDVLHDALHEVTYSLDRINDEQIAQQSEITVAQFKKSDRVRTGIRVGKYVVGAAALVALGYKIFTMTMPADASAPDLNTYTIEQLRVFVGQLLNRVATLEHGPHVGSWAWWQSVAYTLVLTPSSIIDLTRIIYNRSSACLGRTLFSTNLDWFLHTKTRLGLLHIINGPQDKIVECDLGVLPQEIEKCAVALDGVTRGLLPVDVAYQRRHMVESCKQLVEDATKLIAFMRYLDLLNEDDSKNCFERAECSRFFINCTNSFIQGLQDRLNHVRDDKFVPLVQAFNTELQQILIRFARTLE